MLSHLSIGVADLHRSVGFYDAALGALGYARLWTSEGAAGYGYPGEKDEPFAIKQENQKTGLGSSPRSHLAFAAKTREMVLAFHKAATSNGGSDHGEPGLRSHYGPNYFAAFVQDPDGYVIEAVCHVALDQP
ncbi:MAG: VOC family protein [Proteobacteria bacterium]|nr:VOC family protein [Pseudomonadota bacterium]